MPVQGFDHLYIETQHWDRSLAFWSTLGFSVTDKWGTDGHRACRLTSEGSSAMAVVLAESTTPCQPTVHIKVSKPQALDAKLEATDAVKVVAPLENTHWGTSWIRIETPDGDSMALECPKPIKD